MNPADCIVPIIGATEDGAAEPIGSGALIAIGEEIFLITADHVFSDNKATTIYLPGAPDLIQITGQRFGSPDTAYDIAYYRLTSSERQAVHSSFAPLPSQFVEMSDVTADGDIYSLVGYPEGLQIAEVERCAFRAKCFAITARASSDRIYRKAKCTELTHVVVDYSTKRAWTQERQKFVPPSPHCMSGGGVWKRYLDSPLSFRPQVRLCALMVYHERRLGAIRAVRVNLIMDAIRHNHPELSDFIARSRTLRLNISTNENEG